MSLSCDLPNVKVYHHCNLHNTRYDNGMNVNIRKILVSIYHPKSTTLRIKIKSIYSSNVSHIQNIFQAYELNSMEVIWARAS